MTRQELIDYLLTLPEEAEKTRDYELSLTRFVSGNSHEVLAPLLLEVMEGDFSEQVRYNAFYALNILYRHTKDYPKLKEILDLYSPFFDLHITLDHLQALYDIESESFYDYTDILKKTYKDAVRLSDNAGFVHLFAIVFASIYEKGGLRDREEYLSKWYDKALESVNRAIELDPSYAKYYCTKARILLIKKEYSQANVYIGQAIGLEDSSCDDYAMRMITYHYYKMMIYTEMRLNELEKNFMNLLNKKQGKEQFIESGRTLGKDEAFDDRSLGLATYAPDKPYVFISYSHKDADKVYHIVQKLQKKGVRIWIDLDSIPVGMDYTDHIGSKIMDCRIFMPMISSNSQDSEYVRKEIHLASRRNKEFCAVLLEDTTLSPGMDLELNYKQVLHWYKNDEDKNIDLILRDLPGSVLV